jgi:NADH dehydrogenase
MRSLFVTGATGFVGRHFVRSLNPAEFRITCLQRTRRASAPDDSGIRWVEGDLRQPESYTAALAQCDTVVHLAAVTGRANREDFLAVNADGTRALLTACARLDVRDVLLVSTIAVKYPDKRLYPYAESKEIAEAALRQSGLQFTIIRPTIVIGQGAPIWQRLADLASRRMIVLPGDGRARIQPIHVDDVVACLVGLLRRGAFARETYELGGPEVVPFEEFLRQIHRVRSGRDPAVIHLPLRPIVALLSLLERGLGATLPVTAGQLSAFAIDSTADPGLACPVAPGRPMSIDAMIRRCLVDA